MSMIVAIVVLGVLIVVHELGHFLLAKRLGVAVLKFSVGFGPKLLGRKLRETEYVLSAIPLGGYVKMAGEDPDDAFEGIDEKTSFSHQPVWKRVAIVVAGPGFNVAFALIVISAVLYIYGAQVPSERARIGTVMPDMPAARAGLLAGDLVLSVNGRLISSWKELSETIRASEGRELVLKVQREESLREISLRAVAKTEKNIFGEEQGSAYFIGIGPTMEREEVGPFEAVVRGVDYTISLTGTIVVSIVKLLQGKISRSDIGGPILIVQAAGEQARVGLENLLHFTAVISVNLGVLNLLPIPILDGGHLLFLLVELLRRRPVNLRHREIAQQVGLVILVGLMAFAFYNDIARVIRGWG